MAGPNIPSSELPNAILDVTTVVNETTTEEETPVVEFQECTVDTEERRVGNHPAVDCYQEAAVKRLNGFTAQPELANL